MMRLHQVYMRERRAKGQSPVAATPAKTEPQAPTKPRGTGDHLHRLIQTFTRQQPTDDCGCASLVRKMNDWGPDKCWRRREEIVDHMLQEARKRKLTKWPGSRQGATLLLRWAVARTRKDAKILTEDCPEGKQPLSVKVTAMHRIKIAVAITTAPREGEFLLERCVKSLLDTGFNRPLIFAEPDSPTTPFIDASADTIHRSKRYGEWHNWWRAIKETLERRPDADAIMTVQDDIFFCRNVREWLDHILWPSAECGVVHVYTSRKYGRSQPRGLSRLPVNLTLDMAGACALVFPRHVAQKLVNHAILEGWRGHTRETITEPSRMEGVDTYVGLALYDLRHEVWVHNPSLAEHDSVYSTLGHGAPVGNRTSLDFPGVDADPFKLFLPPAVRTTFTAGQPGPPGIVPFVQTAIV